MGITFNKRYYGKHLATVKEVRGNDVKVECEGVYGDYLSPVCQLYIPLRASKNVRLPNVDEEVWIEFEEGIPTRPILVGLKI